MNTVTIIVCVQGERLEPFIEELKKARTVAKEQVSELLNSRGLTLSDLVFSVDDARILTANGNVLLRIEQLSTIEYYPDEILEIVGQEISKHLPESYRVINL